MTYLAFRVYGIPGAQGSKRHVGNGRMVESSKKVAPWRVDVATAARQVVDPDDWRPLDCPVGVELEFIFGRPKSHFRTGAHAHVLKDTAPIYVTSRAAGDADKLARSSLDALVSAGILADDSLVAELRVTKHYDHSDAPGAYVRIKELP